MAPQSEPTCADRSPPPRRLRKIMQPYDSALSEKACWFPAPPKIRNLTFPKGLLTRPHQSKFGGLSVFSALRLGRMGLPCIAAKKRGYVTQLRGKSGYETPEGIVSSMFSLLHQTTTIWIGTARRGREGEFQRIGLGCNFMLY